MRKIILQTEENSKLSLWQHGNLIARTGEFAFFEFPSDFTWSDPKNCLKFLPEWQEWLDETFWNIEPEQYSFLFETIIKQGADFKIYKVIDRSEYIEEPDDDPIPEPEIENPDEEGLKKAAEDNGVKLNCFYPDPKEDIFEGESIASWLFKSEEVIGLQENLEKYKNALVIAEMFGKIMEKAKSYDYADKTKPYQLVRMHPDSTHLKDFWNLGICLYHNEKMDVGVYAIPEEVICLEQWESKWSDVTRGCFAVFVADDCLPSLDFEESVLEDLKKKIEEYPNRTFWGTDFD